MGAVTMVDMVVGFATSKTFRIVCAGGKDWRWSDPSWRSQFGERRGWIVVEKGARIGLSRAGCHRADVALRVVFTDGRTGRVGKFPN